MNTDQLIDALTADTHPRRAFAGLFGCATLLAVAAVGLIFFAEIGPRPDLDDALHTPRFLLKFVIVAPLAAIATLAIYRMAKPALWEKTCASMIAVPLGLLAAAALFELFALPQELWIPRLIGSNSANCLALIPLLATGPLACFLIALRDGASANPGLTGAIAGLAASAIAATFYALNCFDDSPLFVITWYPLATAMVVAAGYLLGRTLLAW